MRGWLNDAAVDLVHRARLTGASAEEAAERLGVPFWTVTRIWAREVYLGVPPYHGATSPRPSKRKMTDADVESRIDRSAGPDGCWPWTGSRLPAGYGLLRGTTVTRWVMAQQGIEVGKGQVVCHRCDNPPCCNPAHLFLGTYKDNSQDAVAKGRVQHGDRHWMRRVAGAQSASSNNNAKLTDEKVVEIRRRRAAGESVVSLAKAFSLHETHVYAVIRRAVWSHV